jgi:RimJ/RimL family protein N-acetyltransferase
VISIYKNPKFSLYSSKKFRFRVIELNDIEHIRKWRNKQKNNLRQNKNISKHDQMKYWNEKILPSFNDEKPDQLLFCLEDLMTKELIAYGGLVHIDWDKKYAESSFLANPIFDKQKKEYESIFLAYLDFLIRAAKQLNFLSIYSETYSFRIKHIKILEKYGYEQYGFLNKVTFPANYSLLHQYILKS